MNLRPYQETGRDFLAGRSRALLADEMRLGKTPQAILAALKVRAEKILVVCPAIGVAHWHSEFENWWPDAEYPDVTVLSYDGAKQDWDALVKQRWDLVIADECHFAKNPAAERTALIYGKSGVGWVSDRMWVLSGTPAPKHAGELWPMLRAFGATALSYDAFLNRYCYQQKYTGRVLGTRKETIPELKGILSRVMLRRKRAEVAPEMPAIDFQPLIVKPEHYVDLSVTALETVLGQNTHYQYPAAERIATALSLVPELVKHIEFNLTNGLLKQVVVFGWHVAPLEALRAALGQLNITCGFISGSTSPNLRRLYQEGFREGRIQVMAANILAGGTVIDLSAARHAYMLELDWVPGNNIQAANRLICIGKNDPVTVDVLTAPGTVYDAVQQVVMRREKELANLL